MLYNIVSPKIQCETKSIENRNKSKPKLVLTRKNEEREKNAARALFISFRSLISSLFSIDSIWFMFRNVSTCLRLCPGSDIFYTFLQSSGSFRSIYWKKCAWNMTVQSIISSTNIWPTLEGKNIHIPIFLEWIKFAKWMNEPNESQHSNQTNRNGFRLRFEREKSKKKNNQFNVDNEKKTKSYFIVVSAVYSLWSMHSAHTHTHTEFPYIRWWCVRACCVQYIKTQIILCLP